MKENRHSGHTTTRLTAHIVWVTKYRYDVLVGDIKVRCRDLLMQICDAEDKKRCRNTRSIIGTRRTRRVTRSSSNEAGLSVPRQPMH